MRFLSYLSNFLAAQSQRFKASGFTPFTYNAWQRFSNIGVFRILPKVYNGAFLWKQSTVFSANYFQKNLHHRCLKRFSIRLWASEIVFSTTVSVILNSFLGHTAKLKTKYAAKVTNSSSRAWFFSSLLLTSLENLEIKTLRILQIIPTAIESGLEKLYRWKNQVKTPFPFI